MEIRRNRSKSDTVFYFLVGLISILAFAITLYPFIYIISVSFSDSGAVGRGEVFLFPVGFSLEGYKAVLQQPNLLSSYGNTLFYTIVGTLMNLVASVMTAYPLCREKFCARKVLNFLTVFTMYFSGGLIPTYLVVTQLGLYNSRWVMILPGLISTYNMMICRSAFSAIPEEVIESAQIDGANDLQTLVRIAAHLIKPTLAVLALYYAVGHWNDYFNALMYLGKEELMPLQVLLRRVLIQNSQEFTTNMTSLDNADRANIGLQLRYVTIVVTTLPILLVYPFVQKYFVKGVMLGAVKG